MKSYEEVAKSVFEKSDKYFEEKALRAKRIKTAVTAMSCFCLAAVLTVGAVAALNGSLTEYPAGGGAGAENNSDIPEYTTTAICDEAAATMPEPATDENGDPIKPDDIWDNSGAAFSNGGSTYDNYIWQTPEEILGDNTPPIETGTSVYIVYDGALYEYSSVSESDSHHSETDSHHSKTDRYYARTGRYAYSYGAGFPLEAYAVKDEPDLIMIEKDYVLWEYAKVMDLSFDIDGEKYEIACSVTLQVDCDYGEMVMETEYFRVHEVLQPWSSFSESKSKIKAYLMNIFPILAREEPGLFIDFYPNYPDYPPDNHYIVTAWWLALPCDAAEEMSRIYALSDDHSLPLNTLSGVTPADIDKILAAAQAASSETGDSTVFVQAEIESDVLSLTGGVVVMEGWDAASGKTIIVQTPDGDYIMYCHLSETFAKKGDTVARAKIIGLAGNTGSTAYNGVTYAVRTSLPTPEKCAVILPEISEEKTESEIFEELDKLGIGASFVWSDNADETVIPMEENAEILSLTDGEVIWIKKYGNADNSVCVRYSEDTFIYYNHLGSLNVKKGDTVAEGQCIGHAGDIEFIDSIFDFGSGYLLTHVPPEL